MKHFKGKLTLTWCHCKDECRALALRAYKHRDWRSDRTDPSSHLEEWSYRYLVSMESCWCSEPSDSQWNSSRSYMPMSHSRSCRRVSFASAFVVAVGCSPTSTTIALRATLDCHLNIDRSVRAYWQPMLLVLVGVEVQLPLSSTLME